MKIFITLFLGLLTSISVAQTSDTLADLIQAGDHDSAMEMLRLGANVNQTQDDGTTALHWAVYTVDEELVETLLSREANPDTSNLFGSNPLSEAVKIGNTALTQMLLEAGADPDARNQDDQTALMLSARIGAIEIAELLIDHGADVNVIEEWRGQTALMWAGANNHPQVSDLLISHGADVNVQAMVLDWGTQISSEPRNQYRPSAGMTATLYAARGGCLDCIQGLVDAGADINFPDPDGVTPLMVAIDSLNYDTADLLLKNGANPNPWDWWGRTALYIAVDMNSYGGGGFFAEPETQANKNSSLDIIEKLLIAGVNPDPQLNMLRPHRGGNNGRFSDTLLDAGATPLLRAANSHDSEASKLLLQYGANVDLPIITGITPLMAAAGFGQARGLMGGGYGPEGQDNSIALLEVLLEGGANPNAIIDNETTLTSRGRRADPSQNRHGQTALYGASNQGWFKVMDFLLANGANRDVIDDTGRSVLDAAVSDPASRRPPPSEETLAYLQKNFKPAAEL